MSTQTQTMTTPYSHDTFHKIGDVNKIWKDFEAQGGEEFVLQILGPIIQKHQLQEVFGVGLLHRHFSIKPDEKLVEFNNITVPWPGVASTNKLSLANCSNNLIYATSWLLDDEGKWMPYEFAFTPNVSKDQVIIDIDDAKYQKFIAEFASAIKLNRFENVLGLRSWPGKGFTGQVEFTAGRANINLLPEQLDAIAKASEHYIPSMWFWRPELAKNESNPVVAGETVCAHCVKKWDQVHYICEGPPPLKPKLELQTSNQQSDGVGDSVVTSLCSHGSQDNLDDKTLSAGPVANEATTVTSLCSHGHQDKPNDDVSDSAPAAGDHVVVTALCSHGQQDKPVKSTTSDSEQIIVTRCVKSNSGNHFCANKNEAFGNDNVAVVTALCSHGHQDESVESLRPASNQVVIPMCAKNNAGHHFCIRDDEQLANDNSSVVTGLCSHGHQDTPVESSSPAYGQVIVSRCDTDITGWHYS